MPHLQAARNVEQYKTDFLNRMNLTLHTDWLNESVIVGNQKCSNWNSIL
jgi:hypothetical protein